MNSYVLQNKTGDIKLMLGILLLRPSIIPATLHIYEVVQRQRGWED